MYLPELEIKENPLKHLQFAHKIGLGNRNRWISHIILRDHTSRLERILFSHPICCLLVSEISEC